MEMREYFLAHYHQKLDPTSSPSAQHTQTDAFNAAGGFGDSVYEGSDAEREGGDAAHGHVADCERSLKIMVQVRTTAGSSVLMPWDKLRNLLTLKSGGHLQNQAIYESLFLYIYNKIAVLNPDKMSFFYLFITNNVKVWHKQYEQKHKNKIGPQGYIIQ